MKFKVYTILSDGDCNEGSTWEAALFAAQHKLDNLTVIVDHNKIQGFGRMKDVINLNPLSKKWKSFNFSVTECQKGNDLQSLKKSFRTIDKMDTHKPKCIIAHTVKGSGVSYMEDTVEWHYLPMNPDQYKQAMEEMEN